ncbi:MAG: PIG-L family deacetylase [Planctomycetota bacterium]|nr:PIG-L family deacetylase [Planctomycetota bacterium]
MTSDEKGSRIQKPESTLAAPWAPGRRILLLIAHPDDEVVGCCAAIGRARAAGAEVFGYVLTTGVPAREVLWCWQRGGHTARIATRREECRAVAALLGLSLVELQDLPTRTLRTSLLDVRGRLLDTLARRGMDTVWAPAYEGAHTDHDSANVLASSLSSGPQKADVRVFEYAEYNFFGGAVRSQSFPRTFGTETVLELSPEEVQRKRQAMALYCSAQRDLGYVRLERECLRPLAVYDYGQAPHAGTLFYQRFQWVFFRHPRVDYTRPEEACRDFAGFRCALGTNGG